ncbi:hypothetical protein E4U51_007808 [Claviceps purpurea]|nr:hypothetical protein E4U51_007808 [Claviceps purpurea]
MALEFDNSPSPNSSSGVEESIRATPDTHDVSTMTPLERQYSSSLGHERDPFFTSHRIERTKLSPTALSFNPFMEPDSIRQLEPASPVATSLSNELGLSRYLLISSEELLTVDNVQQWFNDLEEHGRRFYGHKNVEISAGKVHAYFNDIRDSCFILTTIMMTRRDWKVEYCGPFATGQLNSSSNSTFPNFGQIQVTATIQKAFSGMPQLVDITRLFLQSYGRLFAFVKASCTPTGSLRAIAEFCDISHSLKLITAFTQVTTPEIPSHSYYENREIPSDFRSLPMKESFSSQSFTMYPLMLQSPFYANVPPQILNTLTPNRNQGSLSPNNNVPSSYSVLSPLYCAPPSPALTAQNNYSPSRAVPGFLRPDGRRQNATRVSKVASNGAANHHNHVDVSRIRDGIDVRTTIMLRNIPNKVDQIMLKRIIDESSWGKYDFMYLRIDFANDCNVGYAFINFVDFVEVRGNQRCDKVAEISYASKDCLVQKFRNSSVMLEAPHYRPKLYFTSNGPRPALAGHEEPFPEPDNQSKMKRSCENAEHVGLFTPNAGQHFRDEQRRRRSQYDRGTRLAALEENQARVDNDQVHTDTALLLV